MMREDLGIHNGKPGTANGSELGGGGGKMIVTDFPVSNRGTIKIGKWAQFWL